MASPLDPQHAQVVERITFYAKKYGIDPKVGIWQLWQESRFNINAKSPVGAEGIAQFMPATAKEWGVNTSDLESSLDGWARYMSYLYKRFGTYELALAAYNAGMGNVAKYNGVPPFEETKNYIKTILGNRGSIIGISLGTVLALTFSTIFIYKYLNTVQ